MTQPWTFPSLPRDERYFCLFVLEMFVRCLLDDANVLFLVIMRRTSRYRMENQRLGWLTPASYKGWGNSIFLCTGPAHAFRVVRQPKSLTHTPHELCR